MAAEADTAQDVHLKQWNPVVIIDGLKWFRLENSQIVDEDINVRETRDRFRGALTGTQVRCETERALSRYPNQLCERCIDARLRSEAFCR
jgi:hypothetical protein